VTALLAFERFVTAGVAVTDGVADVDSKRGVDEVSRRTLGLAHETLRTLAVSVSALRHFNFDGF
jgi:hypothetical protein